MAVKKTFLFWIWFLAIGAFAGVLPVPAVQAADNPCGFPFNNGAYEIGSVSQLRCLSQNQPYYLSGSFRLTADIDLTGSSWTPIGVSQLFSGTFDGNGHIIKGLRVNGGSSVGMFGYVSGTIKNLGLEDVQVSTSGMNVGGLVGYLKNGTVERSYVTGSVTGDYSVGGLVGALDQGTVKESYALDIRVSEYTQGSGSQIGGLVGWNQSGRITSSYVVGDVSGNRRVGGLVGYNLFSSPAAIVEYSYAAGTVSGTNNVGELVGLNDGGRVEDSYWRSQEQMKQKDQLGWLDFANTWAILEGVSYPYFKHSGRITVTAPDPNTIYRYPVNSKAVEIQGSTNSNSTLTLRYVLADESNTKLQEGELGSISGEDSFTFTQNFGPLSVGKYSLWLWGTSGAQGTEGVRIQLQVVPSAPANLQATVGEQAVTLTWSAVSGADSYRVYKLKGDAEPDADDWQAAEVEVVNGTSHTFTGLGYGTYWFRVSAVEQGLEGDLAPAVSAKPWVPVVSVETLKDMTVKAGTRLNQMGLPNPVQVTLADNTTMSVPVIWDGGNPPYNNGTTPGTYTFTGMLDLQGTAIINPSNLTATVRVIVSRSSPTYYPVTGVTLSKERLQLVEYGEPYRLEAQVEPFYATLPLVTWESSDPEVAMVDANGVVTPLKAGTAVITVTTTDGGYTAECVVTVVKEDEEDREDSIKAPNGFYIGGDIKRYYSISVLLRSDRVLKQAVREMDEVGLDQVFLVIDNVGATLQEIDESGLRNSLRPLERKDFHEDGYDVIDEQGESSDKIKPGYEDEE